MSGYRDVRLTTSVSSGGGGSAWGSGVFRNNINDNSEKLNFIDQHDRTPVEQNGFHIKKVCIIACSVLAVATVLMVVVDKIIVRQTRNATNATNTTIFSQLLSA